MVDFVEHHDVRVETLRDAPTRTDAAQSGRGIGDLVHRVFERQQLSRSRTARPSNDVVYVNDEALSRCAPASDAPINMRGSRHTSARSCQLASSSPDGFGVKLVSIPPASTRSKNAS